MPKTSKRTQANREIYEAIKAKIHAPAEAIAALRGYKQPKFDQSVEVVCSLGIDPKQADQQVRGSISMPKGTGKTDRVICFCGDDKVEQLDVHLDAALLGRLLGRRSEHGARDQST